MIEHSRTLANLAPEMTLLELNGTFLKLNETFLELNGLLLLFDWSL